MTPGYDHFAELSDMLMRGAQLQAEMQRVDEQEARAKYAAHRQMEELRRAQVQAARTPPPQVGMPWTVHAEFSGTARAQAVVVKAKRPISKTVLDPYRHLDLLVS